MRGMTSSGGNSAIVGFYLDDVPLTGPANAQNGRSVIDPDLYDLNRIEVLRGPQGTLFGSGSMGGTVGLITNQPGATGHHASGENILSGTDRGGFSHDNNIMVNVPLTDDKLASRIVGTENYRSVWIDRVVAKPFPTVTNNGAVRGDVGDAPWLDGGPHWDIPPLNILPEVAPETGTAILSYTRSLQSTAYSRLGPQLLVLISMVTAVL